MNRTVPSPMILAAVGFVHCCSEVRAQEVSDILASHWSDRVTVVGMDETIDIVLYGIPAWISGTGCMYMTERLTFRRIEGELIEAAATSTPYVASEVTPDYPCPETGAASYARLGISFVDFFEVRNFVTQWNRNALDEHDVKLAFDGMPPVLPVRLIDTNYRQTHPDAEDRSVFAVLRDANGDRFRMELDDKCDSTCSVRIVRELRNGLVDDGQR